MTKFKVPLQKELFQVGEVLVILNGEKSCNRQGIRSSVYDLVNVQHGKVGCLPIFNGDRNLFRELEDILAPGHGEGSF